MCNYENFIDWNQFIDILYAVSGKTLESKIDIFIKVIKFSRLHHIISEIIRLQILIEVALFRKRKLVNYATYV